MSPAADSQEQLVAKTFESQLPTMTSLKLGLILFLKVKFGSEIFLFAVRSFRNRETGFLCVALLSWNSTERVAYTNCVVFIATNM